MKITKENYSQMVKRASPPSPKSRDFICAFLVGGLICTLGQALYDVFVMLDLSSKESRATVSVSLIFIAAVLTGIGVFDRIAKFAGAGT
ncbi:MAG: SpoVA/SpoVAEb family sporulation membrane protein, partial [bacterium]|nr:SpoVA/SpoVAEb family sporulation membrane protein [bacterium]